MAGYIGSNVSVTAVSAETDSRYVIDPNDVITVDGSNVGIGTSSPSARLEVHGSSGGIALEVQPNANDDIVFNIRNSTANQVGYIQAHSDSISIDGDFTKFSTSGTERCRIDSSGNFLVGTTNTNPVGNNVGGTSIFSAGGIRVSRAGEPAGFNRKGSDGTIIDFRKDGTTVGSISVTGSSTSYNTSSDYRLKENVTPLDGAADRLAQIPVHRFNFIADPDTTVDGFLAHEVQAIVPEAVTGSKDAVDADGNPEYQGIDQSKLVPLLTAALQEALQKIDALEARVATLEGGAA